MTDTATADPAAEDLVADAAQAEQDSALKSLATIEPKQQRFNESQIAILRQIGLEDATQGDLDLFFHYCRTTGLDPFRRQIYMIGRNTKVTEWVEDERAQNGRRRIERWVTKYTIQTGIDGYRRNGREAAKALGDELRFDGPYFTGEDDFHVTDSGEVVQHWRPVWPKGRPPHAARFVIYRNGEPFEGIAHFDEFVQTFGNSGEPNSMWAKMPRNQIAKCAEALAWRRAYPDDFAGLILEDSAQPTVIDENGNVERRGGGARGRGATVTVDEILDVTPEPEPERSGPSDESFANGTDTVEDQATVEPTPTPEPASDSGAKPETPQVSEPTIDIRPDTGEAIDALAAAAAEAKAPPKSKIRTSHEKRLFTLLGEADVTDREDRLVIYRTALADDDAPVPPKNRTEITSTNDLSNPEVTFVADWIYRLQQAGGTVLNDRITDALNTAALAEIEADTTTEGK